LGSPPTFVPNPSEAVWELASTDTYTSRNGPRARPRAGHDLRRRSRSADCLERCPRPGARSMRLTTTAYARSPSVTQKVLSARSYSAAARWPRTRLRRKRRPKPLGTLLALRPCRGRGLPAPSRKANQVKHILGAAAHAARAAELAAGGIGVWVLRDSSRLASERRFARRPRAIPCHS
jgi:hypothetical protein